MNGRRRLLILPVLVILLFFLINRLGANKSDRLNDQGVRPDVVLAIDERFPDSRRMQLAARQSARAVQKAIDHPEEALVIVEEDHKATACIWAVGAEEGRDQEETNHIPVVIESMVVNTWGRSQAYIKYNSILKGGVYLVPEPNLASCDVGAK